MFPAIVRGHLARKAQLLGIWLRAMLDTRERESCFLLTDVRAHLHSSLASQILCSGSDVLGCYPWAHKVSQMCRWRATLLGTYALAAGSACMA